MSYSERIFNGEYLTAGLGAAVHSSHHLILLVDCGWYSPFFSIEVFIAYITMTGLGGRRLKLQSSHVRKPMAL